MPDFAIIKVHFSGSKDVQVRTASTCNDLAPIIATCQDSQNVTYIEVFTHNATYTRTTSWKTTTPFVQEKDNAPDASS